MAQMGQQAQRMQDLLNIDAATYNTFYHQRHLLKQSIYKELRTTSFVVWQSASVLGSEPSKLRAVEVYVTMPFWVHLFVTTPTKKACSRQRSLRV